MVRFSPTGWMGFVVSHLGAKVTRSRFFDCAALCFRMTAPKVGHPVHSSGARAFCAFFDSELSRNLVRVLVVMVVMMVVAMMMSVTILRLRRVGYREAEEENCSEQKPFHASKDDALRGDLQSYFDLREQNAISREEPRIVCFFK
jgi:hypothetical protein